MRLHSVFQRGLGIQPIYRHRFEQYFHQALLYRSGRVTRFATRAIQGALRGKQLSKQVGDQLAHQGQIGLWSRTQGQTAKSVQLRNNLPGLPQQ